MLPVRSLILRFSLTFGLLLLLIIVLLTAARQPLKRHIIETREITAYTAKSRVLGYRTPDFDTFAQDLVAGHVFQPTELGGDRTGSNYLWFYKKGSELFPELFEMHYMQGVCYFWMGDLPAAETALKESLKINPVFFWAYYNLGLLYLKSGQIDDAIPLLYKAQQIQPQVTVKILTSLEAFEIIWRYMPDPKSYIQDHLQRGGQAANYLLMVALAAKNNHSADVNFNPDQWNPVFF